MKAVIVLSSQVGWSKNEILDLTVEELIEWLESAREVNSG
jgi:hypothetical protein